MAETIGSLVDKITIVNLKIYHMREQLKRHDVSSDFKKGVREKIEILKEQLRDLEDEINALISDVACGKRKIKVYRQFKMYNDPSYRLKR